METNCGLQNIFHISLRTASKTTLPVLCFIISFIGYSFTVFWETYGDGNILYKKKTTLF